MKRRPVDSWIWEQVVAACRTRCGACGASDVKLERGHIIPHSVGGTDDLGNLVPVCLPCNKKFLKKVTPDKYRPADWAERFFLILGRALRPQISVTSKKDFCYLIPTGKQTENSTLIDWQSDDFGIPTKVFTQSSYMSAANAKKVMWKLFEKTRQTAIANGTPPPRRPLAKRQTAIMQFLHSHGEADCTFAADQFAREEEWVNGDKEHGRGFAAADSWQPYCECFEDLVDKGRTRTVRIAEQAEVERERRRQEDAEAVVYRQQMRWNDYIRIAGLTPWPGMSEEDGGFIATVTAEKAAAIESQDVTEERFQRSLEVFRAWKFRAMGELLNEKQKLRDKLAECSVWAQQYNAEAQQEHATRIKELMTWIDIATIEAIRKHSWWVDDLHQSLDPVTSLVGDALEDGQF